VEEWWGSLASDIVGQVILLLVTSSVTWYFARRNRAVWVLEHVRDEDWTLTYRGWRTAWDVQISQFVSPRVSARIADGKEFRPVRSDWQRDDRTMVNGFQRGEELTLMWYDRRRRVASIQTRESESRYEVSAADVRRGLLNHLVNRGA